MISDVLSYTEQVTLAAKKVKATVKNTYLAKFLLFLEQHLRVRVVLSATEVLLGRGELYEQSQLAAKLINAGIIKRMRRVAVMPDEPKLLSWSCDITNPGNLAAGASFTSEKQALAAALSEALERQLWFSATDYFVAPTQATIAQIAKKGNYIAPEQFIGFSAEQRAISAELVLNNEQDVYLWTKGQSLVSGREVFIPAQLVSPASKAQQKKEPLIRLQVTTGLATWYDKEGARLSGMLEVIERDAYMVMWLNQLALPRIDLALLAAQAPPSLKKILSDCKKYRLEVTVIQLITDAPTHAIAVVLEDMSTVAPRFCIGMSANSSLAHAVEHALSEALRGRRMYRRFASSGGVWDKATAVETIGHIDRLYYWGEPENAQHLEFLLQGKIIPPPFDALWETDTATEHYERLQAWCRASNYECVSVSLGASKANVTDFAVEMVVLPDLFPVYLREKRRYGGGAGRLRGIPEKFGYQPLATPFTDRPHPFC